MTDRHVPRRPQQR